MAPQPRERLSEAAFQSRTRELERDLEAAEADRRTAALHLGRDEISEGEYQAKVAKVETFIARMEALDAAKAEELRVQDEEARQREKSERLEAAKLIREADAKRIRATKDLVDRIRSLGRFVSALEVSAAETAAAVRPHSAVFAEERVAAQSAAAEFTRDMRDRSREKAVIEGALYEVAGHWGIGVQFPGPRGDLDVLNSAKSSAIERVAELLEGEES